MKSFSVFCPELLSEFSRNPLSGQAQLRSHPLPRILRARRLVRFQAVSCLPLHSMTQAPMELFQTRTEKGRVRTELKNYPDGRVLLQVVLRRIFRIEVLLQVPRKSRDIRIKTLPQTVFFYYCIYGPYFSQIK